MNVVIIEDEKLSAQLLSNMLKKINTEIKILNVYDSVKKSVEGIEKGVKPDLIFMDIHLADGISFDIFSLSNFETPVIFTTAYNEYAVKAFKYNSIDYLLKPIDINDLEQALSKFEKQNKTTDKINPSIQEIIKLIQSPNANYKSRFLVKSGDSILSITTDLVAHFISEDGLVLLCTNNNKRYALDYNLDQLVELLNPELFFRINRKVIVNINTIQKTNSYFNSRLKISSNLLTEEDAVVSRERVAEFKKWLDA